MPSKFSQTTRSLANDRSPMPILAWLCATVLLCVWLLWFLFADVTVFETSRKARLEVIQLPHHVASSLSGRIVSTSATIGQKVLENQVLIELDASADRLRLTEEETRLTALPPQIASMRAELASLEQARGDDIRATQAALDAAGARIKEADAAIRFARSNESRLKRQSAIGGVAEIDALRAASESDKLSAAKDALTAGLKNLEQNRQMRDDEAQARIENLRRSIVSLEGEIATRRATIARIQQTIAQHVIRAPVTGRIGDAIPLYTGAYITEGQRLFSVVPPGELMIVGDFDPASAIGRVRPGQPATMRLDGFPWAQFGSIAATVSEVATERRDGTIRVEFRSALSGNPASIMQHGASGVIEVAVEQTAPAFLVFRAAGLLLSGTVRAATASPADLAK
jgi:membrane fusion protein, adhesin transport system